ncbi:MAG: Calx-beta domain-containing protein [Cuspidothrix sp.]
MADLFIDAFKTNITLNGTAENDTLDAANGGGNNTLKGDAGDDELFANTDDKLYGEAGNDKLYSDGNGNNILDGGDGNDLIKADRNDSVFGGAGDDTIFGGLGGNTITGGTGKDTFWLANAEYPNTPNIITDFNITEDILLVNVDSFKEIPQLTFINQGNDTLVNAGDKQLAILQGAAPQISIFSIASASATEGNAINFTITRTGNTQVSQNVTISTSINQDDTASANDFTANTETLTFAQGETTKIFSVITTQDNVFEQNETFSLTLNNPTNNAIISSTNGTAKGTINNDDSVPIFSIASASATEGNSITFTVTRTGDAQATQTVNVATSIASGDTASTNDFTAKTETLTFAQGETSKTFTVQTTPDTLLEGNETFTVSLSNATSGAIISSTNGTAKGTIEDSIITITANTQDGPIVGANVFFDGNSNGIRDEDEPQTTTDSTGNFTLEISGASYDLNQNGRIDPTEGYYVATGGKDAITGLPFTGNLRAVAGSAVVTPITTLVSSIVDTGVSLKEALTQVNNALGIPDSVDLVTFNPISTENLGSSESLKVLTAQASVQTLIGQITAAFESVTNIDGITLANQVTSNLARAVLKSQDFNLSNVDQIKSLITNTVTSLRELDNTLNLTKITDNREKISQIVSDSSEQILTATSMSTGFKAQKVAQSDITQDIIAALEGLQSFDDVVTGEALKELINNATIETLVNLEVTSSTVMEDGISNLVYTFTRIGDTKDTLTVNYDITGIADSNDYTGAIPGKGQTITFAAGSSKATLTVDPRPDIIIENDETVVLTLAPGKGYTVGTSTAVTGTINNDDPAPEFSIAAASATEGNSITFTVTRTGDAQATQNVTVATSIASGDTANVNDFTAKTETLTFAQGETTKTFTVLTTQDERVEKDETFTVALTNPTNGALINNDNNQAKGVIINDDIPLATPSNNYVFPIKGEGDQVRLQVSLVQRNSNSINELGVFTVDDAQGNINGIAPGTPGYNQSVISRAKVVFSAISNLPNGFNSGDFTRLIDFNSGDNLRFFLVQGGTVDSLSSGKTPLSNLLIADNLNQKITDLGTEGFTLSWRDGSRNVADFQDLVVKVKSTNDQPVIGTGLQGGNQGEIIDLRSIKSQVKVNFSVYREAAFNNEVYFYKVDNADGQIGSLKATSANRANYLQTALNNLIKDAQTGANIKFSADNQGIQTGTTTITGGTILAPMIIVNGSLSQLLDDNTNNDPQVYFPYLGVNSDGLDHIRLLGNNTFGFEDLPNGGDLDYNDIIIKMNFTPV